MTTLEQFKQQPSLSGATDFDQIIPYFGNKNSRINVEIDEVEKNELKNVFLWARENPTLDPNFKYRFNEFGFRSAPVNYDAEVGYFGCSVGFGVGVPEEYRWSNLLDKARGWTSNSWAVCGFTGETILGLFTLVSKKTAMKKAFFHFPEYYRTIIPFHYKDNDIVKYEGMYPNYRPNFELFNSEVKNTHAAYFTLPETYFIEKFKLQLDMIERLAELQNIEVYFSTWSENVHHILEHRKNSISSWMVRDSLGRNRSHPGVRYHESLCQEFLKIC
jgi:hypothetical protein